MLSVCVDRGLNDSHLSDMEWTDFSVLLFISVVKALQQPTPTQLAAPGQLVVFTARIDVGLFDSSNCPSRQRDNDTLHIIRCCWHFLCLPDNHESGSCPELRAMKSDSIPVGLYCVCAWPMSLYNMHTLGINYKHTQKHKQV